MLFGGEIQVKIKTANSCMDIQQHTHKHTLPFSPFFFFLFYCITKWGVVNTWSAYIQAYLYLRGRNLDRWLKLFQMKVILTRSKPLSERISASLSAICHAIVGGLWQNKKGHDASRHNSTRGEKYIIKTENSWEKEVGVSKGTRHRGKRCEGKICWFYLRQRWQQTEKGRKRKRRRERAARSILRGRNIMSSSHPG